MRKMKDSGIEWIGQIPESWTLGRIGQLYTERKEKVSDVDYPPLSVTMKGIVPQLSTAAKTDAHDDRKLVRKGDFAINSRSDRRGSCGISPYDGSVSLINTILTPRGEMHPVYYDWLFHSTMFSDEFYKWGHGIVNDLWTTNWQDMKKISVPIPSYTEQGRIAGFLDTECARIDAVIEQTRASIEEYKKLRQAVITQAVTKGIRPDCPMKDSGIEWIGEIPADCETTRFQDFGDYKKGPFGSSITKDMFVEKAPNTYKVYEQKNAIYKDSQLGYYYIPEEKYRELIGFAVEAGDIIVSCAGTIGECYIMPNDCEAGVINQALMRIRINSNTEGRYFVYLFGSVLKYIADKYSNGSAMKNIPPFSILKKVKVPAFSKGEQQEIADWLDGKINAIDILIAKKESFLAEMENYKKSVIYEYVTGKKEVPAC